MNKVLKKLLLNLFKFGPLFLVYLFLPVYKVIIFPQFFQSKNMTTCFVVLTVGKSFLTVGTS